MCEIHKYGCRVGVVSRYARCAFLFSLEGHGALTKAGKSADLLKCLDERLTIYRGTA